MKCKKSQKKYKKHLHFQVKCVNIDKDAVVYQVIFLDSSMVEHSAVNRVVVGSSPTRGVFLSDTLDTPSGDNTRLHGQAVKTSPFHGGNTGSIPVGVI